jgi:hypothetical protein
MPIGKYHNITLQKDQNNQKSSHLRNLDTIIYNA